MKECNMTEEAKNVVAAPAVNAVQVYKADDDFADMRPQDKISPRLKLMQALSPEVSAQKALQGEFAINESCVLKRGEKMKIIPIMWFFTWTEFNPDRNAPKEKKVLARSADPLSTIAQEAARYVEVKDSKGNMVQKVTEAFNFIVLIPSLGGYDTFYTITFQRSSHKVGKTFLNRLKSMKDARYETLPIFSHSFELSSEFVDKGTDKKYFAPVIGAAEEVPAERIEELKVLAMGLKAARKAFVEREMERAAEDEAKETDAKDEPNF